MGRGTFHVGLQLLCAGAGTVLAHGDGHMDMGSTDTVQPQPPPAVDLQVLKLYALPSYAGLETYSGLMLAHIGFMVVSWVFVLPIGVMFSIVRSKFALPVQFLFLVLNGVGVLTGTTYNINTPDLYEHNAHHSIGWIATWIMTAQVIMSLLFTYSGRTRKASVKTSEQASFLPMAMHHSNMRPFHQYRWSGDSGHGTEPPSPTELAEEHSRLDYDNAKPEPESEDEEDMDTSASPLPRRPTWFGNTRLDKYLSSKVPVLATKRVISVTEIIYEIIDRTILILGFIALLTGGVTYAGIFRANNVFNGLAHFIKGGIFFWYGLLTLGRWMGSFADFGWAWNIKPTRSEVGWKSRLPTAEFTESFVIFLYGFTNVWLEHLAAWGGSWSAQDFEHVSISIMFAGGGIMGMFIESKTIRKWLNASVDMMPLRVEAHPQEAHEIRKEPQSYSTSLNPIPGLIIFLLGMMMSSHHQDSMVSTTIHKQWGTLLCGFSVLRGFTYLIHYFAPPKSIYPGRPPTELLASFCLISGGITFMASTKDIVYYMEKYELMAMFTFTVTMGLVSFIMAHVIFVLGLKGWAARREQKVQLKY